MAGILRGVPCTATITRGPCIAGLDQLSGKLTRLFHPRLHKWQYHFRWDVAYLVGRTAIGRVTIRGWPSTTPLVDYRDILIQQGRSRS